MEKAFTTRDDSAQEAMGNKVREKSGHCGTLTSATKADSLVIATVNRCDNQNRVRKSAPPPKIQCAEMGKRLGS